MLIPCVLITKKAGQAAVLGRLSLVLVTSKDALADLPSLCDNPYIDFSVFAEYGVAVAALCCTQ